MAREIMPTNSNMLASNNTPTTETFRVSSVPNYVNSLKKLARANADWNLTPEQIVAVGKAGRKIYKIKFVSSPVKFVPVEEDSDLTYVTVAGETVGILSREDTTRVKAILSSFDIQRVSCVLRGGMYKVVDRNCNVETQQQGLSVVLKIMYSPKPEQIASTPTRAVSASRNNLQSRTKNAKIIDSSASTRRSKKNNPPFYKRWWFWVIAVLLVLGSCGNNGESSTTESEPIPTELQAVSTDTYIETTAPIYAPTAESTAPEATLPTEPITQETTYILNTDSEIFHESGCYHAKRISDKNRDTFTGTRSEVIAMGYDPCKTCNP